ncbi:MAG: ribosome silencing factor [Anaerolineae bacterium]
MNLETLELARTIVDLISDKKGTDIILLDIRPVSFLADYFIICNGDSDRQIKAIVEELVEKLKALNTHPLHIEGLPDSGWVLLDYGAVVVHVFAPDTRSYYQLERLWSGAKTLLRMQ